jgi:hypothetical protein
MTTSKGALPVSYYTETPGEKKSLEDFLRIQDELEQALNNRRQLFDPVMLAMAQGFLAPTKTGKFGEALGNVAAQVGPAQQAEEKRMLENIAMRRELAAAKLGAQQASRDEAMLRGMMGAPSAAPASLATSEGAGATPESAPSAGAATLAAEGAPTVAAAPLAAASSSAGQLPRDGTFLDKITPQQLSAMSISNNPRVQAFANTVLKLREDQRKNLMIVGGSIVDANTKEVVYRNPEEQKEATFPGIEGTFRMTPSEREAIVKEIGGLPEAERDARLRELLKGRPTAEQLAARADLLKSRAKGEGEEEQAILTAGAGASNQILPARSVLSFASDPKLRDAFGVTSEPSVLNAIAEAVQAGITTPGGSIKFGGIDAAIANLKLTPEQKRARQIVARELAMLNLAYRKTYLQGQGSVSNMEGEVTALLGGSLSDTPEALAAKAKLIIARAEFDKKARAGWLKARERGESVYQFKDSEDYTSALADLDEKAKVIRDEMIAQASKRPGGSQAGSTAKPAAPDRSGATVQGKTGNWVRQPDGTLKKE